MRKLFTLIITVFVMCSCITSCGPAFSDSLAPTDADKKVVMNIGGKEVQYQEYRYYALNNKRDSFPDATELTEEQLTELKGLIEENAKYTAAIEILADEYGAVLSDSETARIETLITEFRIVQCGNSIETYKMVLEEEFLTDYLFRKLQQNDSLAYLTIDKMRESGAIVTDDASIDALMAGDELICMKEIYIGYADDTLRDYALGRIEEVHSKLLNGEDFAKLMREYSAYTEGVMPSEHGYYTTEYEMPEYIWEAVSALAEGEYSVIIESPTGFHIVMRCEKDIEYMEEIREDITERYASAMYTKKLYELIDSLTVEYTKYGEGIDLNAMS